MLSTLVKSYSRRHHYYKISSSFFPLKTDFDVSCKVSPMETICMKCQNLFSGKYKKNITNLLSAEFAKRVVEVKVHIHARFSFYGR